MIVGDPPFLPDEALAEEPSQRTQVREQASQAKTEYSGNGGFRDGRGLNQTHLENRATFDAAHSRNRLYNVRPN